MACAHECVAEKSKDMFEADIKYAGPSPDEIALVDTAKRMGFVFLMNNSIHINLKIYGEEK